MKGWASPHRGARSRLLSAKPKVNFPTLAAQTTAGMGHGRILLRLRRKIWSGTFARGFTGRLAAAAMGDQVHLLAFRAGALYVGKAETGPVATAQADVALLRAAKHAPELAVQHTVGTPYDPIRHLLRTLLPLFNFPGALELSSMSRIGRLRWVLAGEGKEPLRSDSIACAVKRNTKVIAW